MTGAAAAFSKQTLTFFDGLEEDNSRDYWTRQADVLEREVKGPLAALLESLPAEYQKFHVFRMNRDLRFSKDKSPYKLQHSAIHEDGGIGHYVQIAAGGLLVASGMYRMQPDQLQRYRAAVDDGRSGVALRRLLTRADAVVSTEGVGLPSLKTAPRGFSRDHPRIDLLRRKGVAVHSTLDGPDLIEADAGAVREFVLEVFEAAKPLDAWLRRYVGPSADHDDR